MSLELVPITLKEANQFVSDHHRHHGPVTGHKYSIAVSDGEKIVDTDNYYSAAWRAARAMGYKRLITYILESENGASLRAAGWKCVGQAGGLRWTGERRPTVDLYPAQMKLRFEIDERED